MAKKSKEAVQYTDHAMDKKERCALCEYYNWGGGCDLVRGDVVASGWCRLFERGKE